MKSLGQIAFEAYKASCLKSAEKAEGMERMTLQIMTEATWELQGPHAKIVWEATADAVSRNVPEEVSLGGGY
jgi:hypothetical protein